MDWLAAVDAYCERLAPGFGAEPFNMATGLAFAGAGLVAFWRAPAREDWQAALALGLLGIASALQHGFAVKGTLWADLAANLLYLVLLGRLMLQRLAGARALPAFMGAVAVVALAQMVGSSPALRVVLGRGTDTFLLLTLVLLAVALGLRRGHPATARGIGLAGLVLAAGLPFRFLDASLCPSWPLGTHGFWHLINATSAMILLASLARHGRPDGRPLAKPGTER